MSEHALTDATGRKLAGQLRVNRKSYRRIRETIILGVILLFALVSIGTTLGIIYVLAEQTIQFFQEVSILEYLTGTRWTPLFASQHFGVLPILSATLLIAAIALAVAIPFGLGSAIYLAEFATPRTRGILKPMLEILAGIPTVVYGYFALLFITPILRSLIPDVGVFNALSAGIAMGIMIIPMVASLSEDAISAVPRGLRDAAASLGATDMETTVGVTVPGALSGIVASFILAMSRAVGETMIVTIAAGRTPVIEFNPLNSMQTMTSYIAQVSLGDTPHGTIEYQTIFAVGTTLFVMTLVLNIISRALVRRFREVYE